VNAAVPEPGLHLDVPFETYLQWPFLSQSTLKEGRRSMAHLKAALDGERTKEPTDSMSLGSALHVAFLEPEMASERVVCWKGGRRAGKDWTAFCDDNPGRIILTPGMFEKHVGMVRSLRRHPVVREWLSKIEHTEASVVGDVHGVTMKSRCDALTADPLIDLKVTNDASVRWARRTAMDFGYHIQAYIYGVQFNRDRFMLMMVENSPPYDVVPYELTPEFIRMGEREATRLLDEYATNLRTNTWPGYTGCTLPLDPPEWAMESAPEVTIGGEPAF